MIAIDTNILIYAHKEESEWHQQADECLTQLAESQQPWAIPWPCIHEFLSIATNPRIYKSPTPMSIAKKQVDYWLESPTLSLLGEKLGYWKTLTELLDAGQIKGAMVHDARIAALCKHQGVTELWTADRDFNRFQALNTVNPLVSVD